MPTAIAHCTLYIAIVHELNPGIYIVKKGKGKGRELAIAPLT